MTLRSSFVLLSAAVALAQTPATSPAQPAAPPPLASVLTMPDSAVYAVADGRKFTAGELKDIVQKIPAQQLPTVDAKDLITQIALMKRFAAEAVNQKLDQKSPTREALEMTRNQVLANAYMVEMRTAGLPVSPEEAQKYYENNKNRFEQAKVKLIYIAFAQNPAAPDTGGKKPLTEPEAKTKAEAILKDLKAGGDFVKAVKENSDDAVSKAKDGDFSEPLVRSNPRIPENIKTAVFSLKPGQMTDLIRQPNGFYIFRVEESGLKPFDAVKDQVTNELKESKFQDWMQKSRSSVQVTFQPAAAIPAPAGAAK